MSIKDLKREIIGAGGECAEVEMSLGGAPRESSRHVLGHLSCHVTSSDRHQWAKFERNRLSSKRPRAGFYI